MTTFKERLTQALEMRNMKAAELSQITGISKARISQYMSGLYVPKSKSTLIIANALDVSETWLMGLDVPMKKANNQIENISFSGIYPISTQRIPMLGEIACGEPIYASEDRESYVLAGTDIKADFCLKARGDSMINAHILDGSIVFCRSQNTVENGEIAVVVIEDEATLKRVSYFHDKNLLILKAENPAYPDLIYQGEELNQIHILGKAIACQIDVK